MGKQKHKGSGFWVPLNIVKFERLVQSKVVVWKLLEDLDALAGTISLKVLIRLFELFSFFHKMDGICVLYSLCIEWVSFLFSID